MKIQLINSSKFKITFNKIDLDENNISVHNFLSNSSDSKKFIKAIIEIAYEDFGIKMKYDNFIYEIYCLNFSEFIIIVSNSIEAYKNSYLPNTILFSNKNDFSREFDITSNFSFKFDDNKLFKKQNLYFFFNNFEDFLSFSEYIKNSINFKNINSSLYEYNNVFLLEIITSNLLISELKSFLSVLLEYKPNSFHSMLTLIRFKEFAKVLYSENAIKL